MLTTSKNFPYVVAFSAAFVAFNAAFFSITGLSHLFSGAFWSVVIMASSLEIAKLVSASFLQRYWHTISRWMKIYLSIGVIVLVLITSLGIFGYLSKAYQGATVDLNRLTTKLEVYNEQLYMLVDAKEFLKQAVGAENEEGFIAGFINMFNKNKGGEGTRWANIDLNDPNIEKNDAITEVRKASTYYQYDKNGKVTSQRAFKNNKEFIQAEKEASLRVQAGLAEIQANILKADKSSLDIVEARRELIKFMMAYELASFLQGGTGGRTISDQDVENMLRAIGAKGWTTSEAIVGGTLQLLAINSEKKDLYEALNSDDPSRVIGAIYARNKLLPRFRLDYKNDRKMMYNALEDLKNSPEGKDQEKKNLKYQFDENNQPIINEEKLEADAIIGVG